MKGVFTDADCPNVHKGNVHNVTLDQCQAACMAALQNATAAAKCTAVNFNAAAAAAEVPLAATSGNCVLRNCAPGQTPSGSQARFPGYSAYEYVAGTLG